MQARWQSAIPQHKLVNAERYSTRLRIRFHRTQAVKNASPEIDAYIEKSADFAQPILQKIRRLFQKAYPQIEETIKWGFPHFEHKGIVGNMAAFKKHVSFGFWKGQLMSDPEGLFKGVGETCMNALKVKDVSELPADKILVAYIQEAVALNEDEVKSPRPKKKQAKKEVDVPGDLMQALKKNKKAHATFQNFSYTNRKEYVEWVTEAKQESTRQKRLATAVEWMAEGKPKNWKYMKPWR